MKIISHVHEIHACMYGNVVTSLNNWERCHITVGAKFGIFLNTLWIDTV